jgi:hypothetical protein
MAEPSEPTDPLAPVERPREPERGAPEGAACATHPDRPAAFTCPRCGNYVCIFCFHPQADRCDACLQRDPAAAAPPIAWETTEGNLLVRAAATLASAFRPVFTAPSFARGELARARGFFLLTALPLAMLAGVIPQTKLLLFGSSFAVNVLKNPTAGALTLDVSFAMLAQLVWFALDFLALALPFTSLLRAYASEERRDAALRVLLYRYWLCPAGLLLFFVLLWALPAAPAPDQAPPFATLAYFLRFFFSALLFVAMRATARLAAGVTPLLSYVVVIVPFFVWSLAQPFLAMAFTRLGFSAGW